MAKQHVVVFEKTYLGDYDVDIKCNVYLDKHPGYEIDKISYTKGEGCKQHLCVVFKEKNNEKE